MCGALAVAMLLALSPRLNSVPVVGFLYPQREKKYALLLSALLLVFSCLFYFFGSGWIQAETLGLDPSLTQPLKLALAALLAGLAAVLLTKYRGQPFRSMGWHQKLFRPAWQFGLALILLTLFLQGNFLSLFSGLPRTTFLALFLCLVIALGEEAAFRGYIQMRLIANWGKYGGWAASSILYFVWRLPFLTILGWGTQSFWTEAALLLVQSFLLGWIMQKSRHVLVPALYHAFSMWIAFL
jgi:membrane protease YdiL (CAAX protease family)